MQVRTQLFSYRCALFTMILLTVGMVMMTFRSFWWLDGVGKNGPGVNHTIIDSWHGKVVLRTNGFLSSLEGNWWATSVPRSSLVADDYANLLGYEGHGRALFRFGFLWKGTLGLDNRLIVVIPHWVFLLMFASINIFLFRRVRRLRKAIQCAEHLCACGYDLRASRSRCPECGRAVDEFPAQK